MSKVQNAIAFFKSKIAKINFVIAMSALLFQTTVLYPWHHQLDKDFEEFKKHTEKVLEQKHNEKITAIKQLDNKLDRLMEEMKKATKNV